MNNKNSREMKFRVYSKLEKKFLPSYADRGLSFYTNYGRDERYFWVGLEWFIQAQNLENPCCYIIQQFTGLIDKDGREIYEGDIVQFYKGQPHKAEYEVYWKKCGFSLIDAKRDGDIYGVFTKNLDNLCPADSMTIIGNIFENPELCSTN